MNEEPINRVNWTLLNDFIDSLRKEGVYSEKTLAAMRNALMKFIVYVGMTPIAKIEKMERESFTAFLYNQKSEITDTRLEFEYRRKILEYTKRFLLWLRKKKKINISDDYIDAIRIRDRRNTNWKMEQISADAYKFEDILKVADYRPKTLNMQRAKAAMLMGFLSGLRDGALVTLPFTDVYLQSDKPYIIQMVEHGTHLKNSKNIRTALINNAEVSGMLETVREWQKIVKSQYLEQVGDIPAPDEVNSEFHPYPYWFAPFSCTTGLIDFSQKPGISRASGYRRDLMDLCEKVGITYHRPHTLRHLHVLYLKDFARNYADLETIARNIGDTPAVAAGYGQRNREQITDAISSLFGGNDQQNLPSGSKSTDEKLDILLNMIGKLVNK